MPIMSVRVGTNDLAKARAFYDATFTALGYEPSQTPAQYPMAAYQIGDGPVFMVGGTRDKAPATHANGGTILFDVDSDEKIAAWHAAGLAHGGTCEGAPEAKPQTGGKFGAYLRDPDGNKLGCYHGLRLK